MNMTAARLPQPLPGRVLALGAYLKNAACAVDGADLRWSANHGDLGDPAACLALEASAERLLDALPDGPQTIAHDLHPDFHSTRLAQALADRLGVPALAVQHHHAHLAVVAAEHGVVDEPLVGWALDGVGLGSDGSAWGGELLWLDAQMAPVASAGAPADTPARAAEVDALQRRVAELEARLRAAGLAP